MHSSSETTQGEMQSCALVCCPGRQISGSEHLQTGTASFPNSALCHKEAFEVIAKTVKEAHTLRHARHMLVDDLTIC